MVKYGIIMQKGRFDFKKLIIVGLPAFVLSTPVFWAIIIIICLKGKVDNIIMTIYNFMIIFNIILGYVFITSIYIEEERKVLDLRGHKDEGISFKNYFKSIMGPFFKGKKNGIT